MRITSFDRVVGLVVLLLGGMILFLAGISHLMNSAEPSSPTETAELSGIFYLTPADSTHNTLWLYTSVSPPVKVYQSEYGIYDYAVHPNGQQIALTLYNDSYTTDIWLLDRSTGTLHQLDSCIPEDAICSAPRWSADGRLLAYERREGALSGGLGPARLWIYDFENPARRIYENSQVTGYGAVWNPLAPVVAFHDISAELIRLVDLSTGTTYQQSVNFFESLSFSPDGQSLVYSDAVLPEAGQQPHHRLYQLNWQEDNSPQPLLESTASDQGAVWSPDGSYIAFVRQSEGEALNREVMLFNIRDNTLQQITRNPDYSNGDLRWSPDGRYLLFQRYNLTLNQPAAEIWTYHHATDNLERRVDSGLRGQWLPAK